MGEGGGKELVWFVLCEVTQVICKTLKKDGIAFRSISNIILITVKWAWWWWWWSLIKWTLTIDNSLHQVENGSTYRQYFPHWVAGESQGISNIYIFLFFCNLCISTRYDSLFQHVMRCTLFTIHFSFNTVSMVFADFLSLNVYVPFSGYFITVICLRYHRFKHCHWYYNKLRLFEQLVLMCFCALLFLKLLDCNTPQYLQSPPSILPNSLDMKPNNKHDLC